MNDGIEIQIVEYNSDLQKKSIELRTKVLREPLGLVYTAEQLEEEEHEIHIVAVINNSVVGVLLLKKIDDKIVKMRQVAVDNNMQRSGIGKRLVHFAEVYLAKHNFSKIELHARDEAKDFYLALQYEIIGQPFIEVGIKHYKMIKLI